MQRAIVDYFRCPEECARIRLGGALGGSARFFHFGPAVCYGRSTRGGDADATLICDADDLILPFDPSEVSENLRLERYASQINGHRPVRRDLLRRAYYTLRPVLPAPLRRTVQQLYFSGWRDIAFPSWPLDLSVDHVLQIVLRLLAMRAPKEGIPFIWFWPEGMPACAIMTHDVEESAGRDFCSTLMDLDDSRSIKSSFQIVPEARYRVTASFLDEFRRRGFEINVHDLNHDGRLYQNRATFEARAPMINQYARAFGASGFRAGAMYRTTDWFGAFDFAYDMSMPNVAHLEPQRGGCCTVMPYFIGNLLELPLTTTQDFALFQILRQHHIGLWKQQIKLILANNGLISFIVHPDYLLSARTQQVYGQLLEYLSDLRGQGRVWLALPGQVNEWWRMRAAMRLARAGDRWRIEGQGHERARIAYARLENGRLSYVLPASHETEIEKTVCR